MWTTKKRFAVVAAGRGSGKTELAKRRLVRYLPVRREWSPTRYFYGAPTEGQAKRIAWESILALIPKEWIKGTVGLCITTKFNSQLYVVGLDKPHRLEGDQWDGGVIDESSDIKPSTFRLSILPALTWRNGWCWRIGVPKRNGIGAAEFRNAFETPQDDQESFTWPSADILPAHVLAEARLHMDPKDYREQFEASFETAGGGIFDTFDAHNIRPCTYDAGKMLCIGSDFNVDPMAWVIAHQYEKHLEVVDELFIRDANTYRALDILYGRYCHHRGGFAFYGDASSQARKTSATETDFRIIYNDPRFMQLGRTIHYSASNPPVLDRFAMTNALICNANFDRHLFVDPRCVHLIDDLQNRYYRPGTREPNDVGDLGHITDALGYIIVQLFPMRLYSAGVPEFFISRT